MGSKGSSTTSTSQPPKEVMEMYKYLTEQGKSLQQKPYQAYQGELVPEMNKYQTAALGQTQQYSDVAAPYYEKAARETAAVSQGFKPEQFQQGVTDYMSPYISNVANAVSANLTESQAQDRNAVLSKMVGSGAFGGDRGGIVGAELSRQQGLARAGAMAPIYQKGYSEAADLYGKSLAGRLGAAQQYGTLGGALQTAGLAGAGALGQAGTVPYNIESAKDAAAYQQFAQKQAYPFQSLGFLANIASGLGGGMGGTTTSTQPGPSWLSQLGGLGTLFSMIPSDERLKEGMEPVGKTFDGQTIYKYRLKGDHKTQIGLSAQEVEKHHPDAVGKMPGGMRGVDYDAATQDAAKRGHFMHGGSSQGGLVPANMERQPYAMAGFVPYAEDPLLKLMEGRSKVGFGSYIPVGDIKRMESNLPKPVALEDTSFDTKGLSPYSAAGLGRLYSGAKTALGLGKDPLSYDLGNGAYVTESGDIRNWARGGLVPRSHHKDGEVADGEVPAQPVEPVLPTEPAKPTMSFSNLFNFSGPSLAEKVFNKGQPFSDEARSGILAAGLGMLASRSPFPLVAVGEGGLSGLNTYYNALKNKMDVAKAGSEMNLQSAQAEKERQDAKAKGIESFEKIKQIYDVHVLDDGSIKVFGFGQQEVPLSAYLASMREVARYLGVPVEQLIREHARTQNAQASGGRAGKALGGLSNGFDDMTEKSGLAAATPVVEPQSADLAPKPEDSSLRDLAISSLKPAEITPISAKPVQPEEKPIQVAQVAPTTKTDASVSATTPSTPSAAPAGQEDLHPTLRRILQYSEDSKKYYNQADEIDGPNGILNKVPNLPQARKDQLASKAAALRLQGQKYQDLANDLMKTDQTAPGNVKFRWEYGAEQQENAPPKPITPETPRGQIDPDTGRINTASVDVGYPVTGGLPTVKLGKHQVLSGDDPILSKATERSEKLLTDFYEKGAGTQEGIVNTIKFASALKAVEAGALSGNAAALAAIAKDLGFDSIAKEISLGKDIAEVEIALKSNIYQGLATLTQNFPRPTQSEFGVITQKASPSVDQQAKSANSLATTSLAAMLWQNSLMRDWQVAQANGVHNFEAFHNNWRQVNDRALFEDAAKRLLGNFKGQPLPSDDQLVEGAVYVVPNAEKGKTLDPVTERAYKMGLTGGDLYTVQSVKHYKEPVKDENGKIVKDENGKDKVVDKVRVGKVVKLSPDEVYSTMLQQPGFAYGAR